MDRSIQTTRLTRKELKRLIAAFAPSPVPNDPVFNAALHRYRSEVISDVARGKGLPKLKWLVSL